MAGVSLPPCLINRRAEHGSKRPSRTLEKQVDVEWKQLNAA